MKPLKDWMELQLWEPQVASVEVQLVLPDVVNREQSEAAVFRVLSKGPDVPEHIKLDDIILLEGDMAIVKAKKPNGRKFLAAHAGDIAFIMEEGDLQ